MQLVFRFALNRAVIDTAISVVEFTHLQFFSKSKANVYIHTYTRLKFLTTPVRCLKLAVLLKHIGYGSPVSNSRK